LACLTEYRVHKKNYGRGSNHFLIHVLPQGFHRIRYYGLFASGTRADNIARARELLTVAKPEGHPSQTLAAGRANRDFDRQATLGGLFSALTGTNGSTNVKRQRDDNQGERRQCCPIKALSTILKNSRSSDRS
jgi:Putative transposase